MGWESKLSDQMDTHAGYLLVDQRYIDLRDAVLASLVGKPGWLTRTQLPPVVTTLAREARNEQQLAALAVQLFIGHEGALVLTQNRILLGCWNPEGEKTVFGDPVSVLDYPLVEVVAVRDSSTALTPRLTIEQAYGAEDEMKAHSFGAVKELVVAFNKASDGLARPAAPSRPSTGDDDAPTALVDELVRLADLHDRGLLTADEFTAAKAKLLG